MKKAPVDVGAFADTDLSQTSKALLQCQRGLLG